MSSNAVDVRLPERFEYLENLTVRGRDTKNTLTANCIFLPQRRLHTAQESYKRFAHSVPKVQITSTLPAWNWASGEALCPAESHVFNWPSRPSNRAPTLSLPLSLY
jgi:hypothetical protein